jgi:hypothetical protein
MKVLLKRWKFGIIAIPVALLLAAYYVNITFVSKSSSAMYDFGSFIASGQLANEGKNPYSSASPLVFSVIFPGNGLEGVAPNLNPPISVLIFQTFANINPFVSITIWRIVSILIFIAALIILHCSFPLHGFPGILRLAWAFALAGFWHNLQLGQIYSLLLILSVLTWVLLGKYRSIAAGIFLGILIAIKPNFVFWAILLCLSGNWRIFLTAGLTAAGISAIPLATGGTLIYSQWLEASAIFTPNLLLFPGNNSLQGLTARFGSSMAGIVISLLLVVYTCWHVYRTRPPISKINSLGIIVSLLISPIAWTGYTLLALPIFFEHQKWDWKLMLVASIFAVPFLIPLALFQTSNVNFILFGWFYGWGLLILLFGTLFTSNIRTDRIAATTSSIHTN